MKKIALVNPPYPGKDRTYMLGLGYISAVLNASGIETLILDEPCAGFTAGAEALIGRLGALKPDVVGLALTSSLFVSYTYDFARLFKRAFPETPLVAGGVHATLLPEETLRNGFDAAIIGDGEVSFPLLLEKLRRKERFDDVQGCAGLDEEGNFVCKGPAYVDDLDSLPFPTNRFFADNTEAGRRTFLVLLLGRGCPHACSFCVERRLNRRARFRGIDNVMSEINDAVTNRGVRNLHFIDSSFLEDEQRVISLCEQLARIRSGSEIGWKCMARADHLSPDILKLMKDAGCEEVFIGLESMNQDTLDKISKNVTVEQNEEAIRRCSEAGVTPVAYLIAGFPWETPAHVEENMAFISRHRGEMKHFTFAPAPFPGTELYETYKTEYGLEKWWLREKWSPMSKPGRPLFRWLQCKDGFLERNFFRYTPEMWNKLLAFITSSGDIHDRDAARPVVKTVNLALGAMSEAVFKISPELEHLIMPGIHKKAVSIAKFLKSSKRTGRVRE